MLSLKENPLLLVQGLLSEIGVLRDSAG